MLRAEGRLPRADLRLAPAELGLDAPQLALTAADLPHRTRDLGGALDPVAVANHVMFAFQPEPEHRIARILEQPIQSVPRLDARHRRERVAAGLDDGVGEWRAVAIVIGVAVAVTMRLGGGRAVRQHAGNACDGAGQRQAGMEGVHGTSVMAPGPERAGPGKKDEEPAPRRQAHGPLLR